MPYTPGDFYRICDRCGRKVLASDTRKEWTGMIVCLADYEERHPQDFVRGKRDNQRVQDPRPPAVDTFIGPLSTTTTAAAAPGATTISVESTARMSENDHLRIALTSGDFHRAVISTIPSAEQLVLTAALPDAVASGALVVDISAVSEADIG